MCECVCMCVCMRICAHVTTYHGVHVKVIEQLVGVSSLLLCKFPELNFSHPAWQQTPVLGLELFTGRV